MTTWHALLHPQASVDDVLLPEPGNLQQEAAHEGVADGEAGGRVPGAGGVADGAVPGPVLVNIRASNEGSQRFHDHGEGP